MMPANLLRLLVGVFFVACVGADAGDEFSNNLFSDLAPYVLYPPIVICTELF